MKRKISCNNITTRAMARALAPRGPSPRWLRARGPWPEWRRKEETGAAPVRRQAQRYSSLGGNTQPSPASKEGDIHGESKVKPEDLCWLLNKATRSVLCNNKKSLIFLYSYITYILHCTTRLSILFHLLHFIALLTTTWVNCLRSNHGSLDPCPGPPMPPPRTPGLCPPPPPRHVLGSY